MHEILLHCFTKIRCVRGFVRDVYMYDHSNSQGAAIDGLEDLTCVTVAKHLHLSAKTVQNI